MRPKRFDFDPDNTDDNAICAAQAVAGAGALTLNGAYVTGGVAVLDYARRLDQITAGNDAGITFTYVGTDANGIAQTEVVAGGAGTPSTETTTKYFKTITSITASGAAAGNVTVGFPDELNSQIIPIDAASDSACAITVDVTGTIDYTVEESFNLMNNSDIATEDTVWTAITAFSGKTTDVKSTASLGATAIRFVVNSYTNTAEAQMYVSQPVRG